MKIQVQHYRDSGHCVVRIVGPKGQVVMSETADNPEAGLMRLKGRLEQMIQFGRTAEALLEEIEGVAVETIDSKV